jgi:DNA-binding transcriptional LysR family regulator
MHDLVEFRHLKYLIAVAEEGNITRAARRLFVSQPALSTQIRELEETLHVTLLVRTTQGVQLTPAADALVASARQLLQTREESIQAVRIIHKVALPPLRLGYSPFVDRSLLDATCNAFRQLFPAGEIRPMNGDTAELIGLLDRREIDAALLTLPLDEEAYSVHVFTHQRLVVCMRKDDVLASNAEIEPLALASKLTIFRDPKQHPAAHIRLLEMLREVSIQPAMECSTATPNEIQWMVKSKFGYGLILEGTELDLDLTTRPVRGVNWTVDSALVYRFASRTNAIPLLLRDLKKRFRIADPSRRKSPQRVDRAALSEMAERNQKRMETGVGAGFIWPKNFEDPKAETAWTTLFEKRPASASSERTNKRSA